MPNHFHLVVETPRGGLVAGMKWWLGTYTLRFNRRHRVFGHLFSGRYKALIVDGSGSGYLKTVCDYVHLNPVRAGLVKSDERLSAYVWSSWPEYLKAPTRRWPWLRVDRLLGEYRIPKDNPAGRRRLEEALEARRQAEDGGEFNAIRRGWFLGDQERKEELLVQMGAGMKEHHGGAERRESAEELAERMVREGLRRLGWEEEELTRRHKGDVEKVALAKQLRKETTVTLKWIARRLGMGSASMVAHCLRGEQETKSDC
jgi:hypothetical protein